MDPRLIAISGSSKGTIFALTEDEVSVGREASNSIHLNELSVSRRHCLIKREQAQPQSKTESEQKTDQDDRSTGDEFAIVDLESYNGTFVNDVPVRKQTLAHGDQIALGDVVLLFLLHEAEAGTAAVVQLDEDDLITRSTVRLQREENALLKISTTINSIRSLTELQTRLLESIHEVLPAENEAILLADSGREAFASVRGWNKLTGPDDSVKPSRTITNQVLREGVALLSNDIFENQSIAAAPSLIASRICSVLCVPLMVFERPLGVVYLDTSDPASRFDEGHLQLLTAIAGIAAVAFANARHVEWLEDENQRLQEQSKIEHKMVGQSAAMRAVYEFIAKVAPADTTVLIRGESGTGKELAAHAIHLNSSRSAKPFLAINCATLTETLLESELFGHEKGAFTGAIAQKRGKLEIADGGTVFMDEVGELTPLIQAKLLRVLQAREFERLGGTRPIRVDVRILAATNQNLEESIKAKKFREDLYYRLNVVSVVMPPLRSRREDIPLLANYFVSAYSKKCKRRVLGISPEARSSLQAYDWPGNVRELENAVERAVVLGSTELITVDDLPEALLETGLPSLSPAGYYEAIKEAKKRLIIKALEESQGNYTAAAKQLGVHPNNLHRLVRNLDLKAATGK